MATQVGESMFFEPLCSAARGYGYSFWPKDMPHWWMSLAAADQGAWAAGIGALAAAAVALFISQKDQFRRNRLARSKQRIAASYHFTPLAYLARDGGYLHISIIKFCDRPLDATSDQTTAKFRQNIAEMLKIVSRIEGPAIGQLPPSIAEAIGFAMGGYTFVAGEIDSTLSAMSAKEREMTALVAELRERALNFDGPVNSTIKFIKWFKKEFDMEKDPEIASLLAGIARDMTVPVPSVSKVAAPPAPEGDDMAGPQLGSQQDAAL
jgi:hypothetical protein